MVEVDERVCRPERLLKLLAADDLAGTLEQHRQDLDRLLLKPDAQASLAQFTRHEVQLEDPEDEPSPGLIVRVHDEVNLR
jgi:hypothetical protein